MLIASVGAQGVAGRNVQVSSELSDPKQACNPQG